MTRFISTRGGSGATPFSAAVERGLCPDGGLYVPERFPRADLGDFTGVDELPEIAARVLAPFFAGDELEPELRSICDAALSFPIPLTDLEGAPGAAVLELFWGPTAAFKDVGARFLAECLQRSGDGATRRTILVATSGDTGGAVAAAFHGRPGFDVCILFPAGGVSPRQQHQLTCWGDNVHSFAVRGTFDDCQRLLKQALADPDWRGRRALTTANSISIGRLLPQVVYYAAASLGYARDRGAAADFIVPSGNVGNATAALWAKAMGFPIGRLVMATNANRPVPDYLATGRWEPRPSLPTLANAMDVGDPSNMERVRHLHPHVASLREHVSAVSVPDDVIQRTIRHGLERWGRVWDPHTATAMHVLETRDAPHQVVVATAHPAKFDAIVEPLIGRTVDVPPALADLLDRPAQTVEIEADLSALADAL